MSKPLSPKEAMNAHCKSIPEFVIDTVNELLSKRVRSDGSARIYQDEIQLAMRKYSTTFNIKWLDFEPLYREVGWDVVYNKGDWNDPNDKSYFDFKPLPH
jgi:hypothetical protein